jgi:hypothetical protein
MYFLQQKVAAAWLLTIRQGEQLQKFEKWFRLFLFPEPESCFSFRITQQGFSFFFARSSNRLNVHQYSKQTEIQLIWP